jgi:hypothetical protein
MLGVLAIFSLNLAAMPCSMALEAGAESGHCPPMAEQAMAHAGHQESQAKVDCLSLQSDCCSIIQATADNRGSADKLQKDACVVFPVAAPWPALQKVSVQNHELRPPDPEVCFPPLHVLNCVYLD